MGEQAEARRREATRTFVRYFALAFVMALLFSGLVAYAVVDSRAQRHATYNVRVAYCTELEKLKTQNREDVARDRKNYARNLKLLGIRDTPELRKVAEEGWNRRMQRNAKKDCPYD